MRHYLKGCWRKPLLMTRDTCCRLGGRVEEFEIRALASREISGTKGHQIGRVSAPVAFPRTLVTVVPRLRGQNPGQLGNLQSDDY